MTDSIEFKISVVRDLKKTDKEQLPRILDKIESDLALNASRYPELKGPFSGLRKCRIGDYRVIYTIIREIVLIVRISHRQNAYI